MAFMGGTASKHRELHDTEPFPWTSESLIPEISRLLLNSKFCYRFPKSRPLCPILSQMKPFLTLTPIIFKSVIVYDLPLWFFRYYEHTQIRGSIEYFVTFFFVPGLVSHLPKTQCGISPSVSCSDIDYWTYTFDFHPHSQDLSFLFHPPEAPFPCNKPPSEPAIINYASLFLSSQNSSQNSSILDRRVSKK
jgi:hypothetical protein